MHTKRNRKHHYSRRRRHCRSRRAGGLGNLSKFSTNLPGTGRKLTSAINKVKDIQVVNTDSFIGKMNIRTGKYIEGNLFYERDGTRVGVHATNFDNMNRPCGTVMRIHLNGNPILDNFGRPIREYVTCDNSHIKEYPFL